MVGIAASLLLGGTALPGGPAGDATASTIQGVRAVTSTAAAKEAKKPDKRKKVAVGASLSASHYLKHAKVSVRGRAKGAPKGTRVTLQRKAVKSGRTRWTKVASTRTTTKDGRYKVSFRPSSGRKYELRTVVAATKRTRVGTSATRTLRHTGCGTTAAAPSASHPFDVWFNDASKRSATPLRSKLRALLCATAAGATVRISLYILESKDHESVQLLSALRYLHTERGVHVKFVVESGVGGVSAASIKDVRRFASVTACKHGCFNTTSSTAHSHDKIVAISKMAWSRRTAPVLVVASANWSDRQLKQFWQSATAFYADRTFYDDVVRRFEREITCAKGRCSTIKTVSGARWVHRYGNWGIVDDPVLTSARGSGVSYRFFPAVTKRDNVLDTLRSVEGCSKGGTVRVAMYAASGNRPARIGAELGRLRKAGCSVKILVSQGGGVTTPQDKVADYRRTSGVAPQCVELMHLKFAVLRGVSQKVGQRVVRGQTIVLDGSQNWTAAGLKRNDETAFVLSTAGATSSRARSIRSAAASYASEWTTVSHHTRTCGTIR
ncbi:hypothetical protein KDY119_02627 [Luteimicrobium xylanilyticum]|uniref:phospholipase D n=1 Tax=Luteimicrobium xylanilyticum TaxID=1133546 RepID=A0A5P9QCC0_9MICO|nr:hypothetical protein KDY119_02627 [Luteimicrobium xylanilyticum]